MTFEFESKGRSLYDNTVCRNHRGMSELTHIQCSPSLPLLSCLSRERLNPFDSTVKLLIWCWMSAGSLSTLYIRFRHSLIKLRWGRAWGVSVDDKCKCLEPVNRLFGKHHHHQTVFYGPFTCPRYPITKNPLLHVHVSAVFAKQRQWKYYGRLISTLLIHTNLIQT